MLLRTVISDFARTILFPKDPVTFLQLNEIHKREIAKAKNKNVYALNKEDYILSEALYSTADFFEINFPILEMYKRLKAKGVSLILFTNSYIPTHPEMKEPLKIFDKIINIHEFGNMTKKDAISYKTLSENYNINPEESIFIDDDELCIKAAQDSNFTTIQFPVIKAYTRDQLYEELRKAVEVIDEKINKLIT